MDWKIWIHLEPKIVYHFKNVNKKLQIKQNHCLNNAPKNITKFEWHWRLSKLDARKLNKSKISLMHILPLRQPDEYWTHRTQWLVWFASIHLHLATGAHSEAVLLCFCFCLDITSHHNGTEQYQRPRSISKHRRWNLMKIVNRLCLYCIGSCLQMNKPTAEHVERKTKARRIA